MLVDHHCHLDFPDFAAELDDVVARARGAGVGTLVTISTRIREFDKVRAVAERFDNVYCSVGTHPHNAHEELDIPLERIVELAQHPKVVAIGEAGLDYYYKHSTPEAQAEGFRRHIAAARETGLPLEIHTRDADDDTIAILEDEHAKGAFPAVLHCFTGGRKLAMRALELGLYVSFSGVITFKKSGGAARNCTRRAARSHSGRDGCTVLGAGSISRKTQRTGVCRSDCGRGCGDKGYLERRDRARDDRQLLPPLYESQTSSASSAAAGGSAAA